MSRMGVNGKALPEGWREVKLGEIAKIYSGGTPLRSNAEYWGDEIPWVKTTQIRNGIIDLASIDEYISEKGLKNSSAKVVPNGAILMAMYGQGKTRGRVSVLGVDAAINQACAAIEVHESECTYFIFQQLIFRYKSIRKISNHGSQKNLSMGLISQLVVALPSLSEQKAIASLLETWDTAIERTEALIVAKEKRFKWLLKTLISDQKNNPDWQRMKLGDLFGNQLAIEKGVMLTKAKMRKGDFPVVAGGRTYASFHNEYTHSAKTITVSSSGAYAGFVSFHDYPIFATDCNVITVISGVIEYFYYAIKMQQDRIYKLQSGGAQPHVYAKDIAFLDMFIPPQKTQKQIACMLNDAQREIALHKQLVELYQRLKSGLMQKLLTGKWRVRNEK